MENIVKIALIYAGTLFVFVFILFIPGSGMLILYPLALISPLLIALTALFLTRNISIEKRLINLLPLSIAIYIFGLIAYVLALWCAVKVSDNGYGYKIWYPLIPSIPVPHFLGLYGVPAIIFMAGYSIRLLKRIRAACHKSTPTNSSEDELC